MTKWTIKESLQIMFPRPSKSLENSISYKFYKKVRGYLGKNTINY